VRFSEPGTSPTHLLVAAILPLTALEATNGAIKLLADTLPPKAIFPILISTLSVFWFSPKHPYYLFIISYYIIFCFYSNYKHFFKIFSIMFDTFHSKRYN
jgi:hypothetical protein